MKRSSTPFLLVLPVYTRQTQHNRTRFVPPHLTAHTAKASKASAWKFLFLLLLFFVCGINVLITQTQAAYQQQTLACPTQVSQWLTQCTKHVPQELIIETKGCFEGLTEQADLATARMIFLRRFQIAEFFMMSHGGTLKNFKEIVQFLDIYHKYVNKASVTTRDAITRLDDVLAKTGECPFSTIELFIEKFSTTLQKIQEVYELFQETCKNNGFQAIRDALDIGEAILQLKEGAQAVKLEPKQPFFPEEDLDAITFLGIDNTLILFANKSSEARDILAAARSFSAFDDKKDTIKKAKQGLDDIENKIRELQDYFSSDGWPTLIDETSRFPDAYLNSKTTAVLINQADRFLQEKLNQYDHRILYPFHLMIQAFDGAHQQKLSNQYASALKNFIEYSTVIDFMEQVLSKIKTVWAEESKMPLKSVHEEALWTLADTKAHDILPVLKQCTNKKQKKLITLIRYYLSLLRIRLKTVAEYKDSGSRLKNNFGDQPIMPPVALYYFCFLRSILTGKNELFNLQTDVAVLNKCIFTLVCTFWQEVAQQDEGNAPYEGGNALKLCNDLALLIQSEWEDVSIKQAKKKSHEQKKSLRKQKRKKRHKK